MADAPEQATEADIELESRRLVDTAWDAGIPTRLLGGLAVAERVPPEIRTHFDRTCGDIDVVIPRRESGKFASFMERRGYAEDVEFNAMNGRTRLVFVDQTRRRDVDVFVDGFEMCHIVPLRLEEADRAGSRTLLLADLMLTKLQIVKLTEKDVIDVAMLLMTFDVTGDDTSGIDGEQIASQCAKDWGLWRTATGNLTRLDDVLPEMAAPAPLIAEAQRRVAALGEQIEAAPKTTKWRMRARVGERVRWYEEPDEK